MLGAGLSLTAGGMKDGTLWAEGLASGASFKVLYQHARETILKRGGKDFADSVGKLTAANAGYKKIREQHDRPLLDGQIPAWYEQAKSVEDRARTTMIEGMVLNATESYHSNKVKLKAQLVKIKKQADKHGVWGFVMPQLRTAHDEAFSMSFAWPAMG